MLHTRIRMVVLLILIGFLAMAGSVQAQTYIRGHVKDTGGRGIGNVLVLLYDAQTMELVAGTYTNDEGLYELDYTNSGDPIPLGTYKVCVSPGQDYFEQCYQGKDKPEEADVLRLTDVTPSREKIDFTLEVTGGKVLDVDNSGEYNKLDRLYLLRGLFNVSPVVPTTPVDYTDKLPPGENEDTIKDRIISLKTQILDVDNSGEYNKLDRLYLLRGLFNVSPVVPTTPVDYRDKLPAGENEDTVKNRINSLK